jgi:hypothetical protein
MLSKRFLSVLTASVIAVSATAQVTITAGTSTFFDISTTGTAILGAGDDTAHQITSTIGNELLPAGSLIIGTNGHVIAAPAPLGSTYTNTTITSTTTAATALFYSVGDRALLPFWDDLYASALPNATLYWQETGGVLYIQWNLIGHFATLGGPTGPAITFQIQVIPGGGCTPSVIHMVYPDATFGGGQAINDNGASATVGYIGATTGDNAQYSFNTIGSIPDGTSLTVTMSAFNDSWSSPFGPGSIQYNVCGGSPFGTYQLLATLNQGAFPAGWLYGIDITYPELTSELGAAPFLGALDGTGSAQIGPLSGLPSGLTVYALTFNIPPGSVPTVHTDAEAYTVP